MQNFAKFRWQLYLLGIDKEGAVVASNNNTKVAAPLLGLGLPAPAITRVPGEVDTDSSCDTSDVIFQCWDQLNIDQNNK